MGTLLVSKAAAPMITLDWGNSCSKIDTDYAVYEGPIGAPFNTHLPVSAPLCAVGATTATFTPAAGSIYYLVVPTAGTSEGSYGAKTNVPTERPRSTAPCVPAQSLGTCY